MNTVKERMTAGGEGKEIIPDLGQARDKAAKERQGMRTDILPRLVESNRENAADKAAFLAPVLLPRCRCCRVASIPIARMWTVFLYFLIYLYLRQQRQLRQPEHSTSLDSLDFDGQKLETIPRGNQGNRGNQQNTGRWTHPISIPASNSKPIRTLVYACLFVGLPFCGIARRSLVAKNRHICGTVCGTLVD